MSAPLRVVTWNIRAGIGPGDFPPAWWREVDRARLEGIGAFISDLDADVVALQEVALSTIDGVVDDQAADIARIAGLDVRYGAVAHFAVLAPDGLELIGACFWGNAVLSRRPIRASRTIGLPIPADDDLVEPLASALELAGVRYADAPVGVRERRCVLECEIDLDGAAARVLATHLTHVGSAQRRMQAQRIAGLVAGLDAPAIVAGDLNAPIDAPELAPLAATMVDAFTASGVPVGDERRASFGGASLGIDHILVRGADVGGCEVLREAADLSDHWPVRTTVTPWG